MKKKTKQDVKDATETVAHGLGDVVEVAGHIVAGTIKGAADGVEVASNKHEERRKDSELD